MSREVQYIGLDVDDKAFHGAIMATYGNEVMQFVCKPNIGALLKKLGSMKVEKEKLRICYEAGYLGFTLCREFRKNHIYCDVIAPSLIPDTRGKKVKTDRLDSVKLAQLYRSGLLTSVHVPSQEDEAERDLIRSRNFLMDQCRRLQKHILALIRRHGMHYKGETGKKRNWTITHIEWLETQSGKLTDSNLQKNLCNLLHHYKQCTAQIDVYNEEIESMANSEKYKKKVKALVCYRGIKTQTAMTLITELGDIKRFSHPEKLTSYCGMDITEYSSGGKEKKYRMTKMGNKHIRTAVIESCQLACNAPRVGPDLRRRRQEIDPKMIDVADRCMKRLYKKGTRLLHENKIKNKVKTACAREMLGFIWESLRAVA